MVQAVQDVLDAFEKLSDEDRQAATLAILRRTLDLPLPTLSDVALYEIADGLFQSLDEEER